MVRGGGMKRKGGGDRRGEMMEPECIIMMHCQLFIFINEKIYKLCAHVWFMPTIHVTTLETKRGGGVREIQPSSQPPAHLDPTTLSNAYKHVKTMRKTMDYFLPTDP